MVAGTAFPNDLGEIKDCVAADGTLVDAAPTCVLSQQASITCAHFVFSSAGATAQGAWPGRKIGCYFGQDTAVGDKLCCSALPPCPGRGADEPIEDVTTVEVTLPAGATSPTVFYTDWDGHAFSFVTGDIQ
jgi:hypothetical protein